MVWLIILKVGHLAEIWTQPPLFVETNMMGVKASQSFEMFPLQQYVRPGLPYNCHCLFHPQSVDLHVIKY